MSSPTEPQTRGPHVQSPDEKFAIKLLEKPCFHQSTNYNSPSDGRTLKVSFGTTSNFDDGDDMPTILYLGPLMCSRYFLCMTDALACTKGVRAIFIERPGFGSSTPIAADQRISHALASIPNVLSYLHVKHVALLSGSAGTLCFLNFLVTPSLRKFLHPQHPYAAALVPFVHHEFSKTWWLSTAAKLPESAIGNFGTLAKPIGTSIIPSINWSGGLLAGLISAFGRADVENNINEDSNPCGMNQRQFEKLNQLLVQRVWTEDTSGLGQEVLLLLQKNLPSSSWGFAASYPDFVTTLRDSELKGFRESPTPAVDSLSAESCPARSRLRFRTFFASSDIMIGDTGREYFDACFKGCDGLDEAVDYTSQIIEKSNHDSVMDVRQIAIGTVFDDVKKAWNFP